MDWTRLKASAPMTERYIHDRALELFRNGRLDLDSAICTAAAEYDEQRRQAGIVDEPGRGKLWTPPAHRMTGAERVR